FSRAEGLGDVVVGSEIETTDAILFTLTNGENDDGDGGNLTNRAKRFKAVHFGHHDVEDNEIGQVFAQPVKGFEAIAGFDNTILFHFQVHPHKVANTWLIIDDEDSDISRVKYIFLHYVNTTIGNCAFSTRGKLNEKVEPLRRILSTQIWPPCASTMARQM